MERNEYLNLCKAVAKIPKGVAGIKAVPEHLWVVYDEIPFYPVSYTLSFNEQGEVVHLATMHDRRANSVKIGLLERVTRWKENG